MQCPYGVEKVEGDEEVGGCPVCECRDPCKNFPCMEDEQCAVDIVGTIAKPHVTHGRQVYGLSHQTSYRPVCRKRETDFGQIFCGIEKVTSFTVLKQKTSPESVPIFGVEAPELGYVPKNVVLMRIVWLS